jgi:hypothetical protein
MKRSVALVVMTAATVGGAGYALMPGDDCASRGAVVEPAGSRCGSGGSGGARSSGSGGHGFFSSSGTRDGGSGGASGEAGGAQRGGFGSFARSVSAHFGSFGG